MQFFKRLFDATNEFGGRKPNIIIEDSLDFMVEKQFWSIIHHSFLNSKGNFDQQQVELSYILSNLKPIQILEFYNTFRKLRSTAYTFELWAAAYIMLGGCSSSNFLEFRGWLISLGKDTFEKALKNPESLIEVDFDPLNDEWTGFQTIPPLSYRNKTQHQIPLGARIPEIIKGDVWDENCTMLQEMYPELFEKYKGNFLDF